MSITIMLLKMATHDKLDQWSCNMRTTAFKVLGLNIEKIPRHTLTLSNMGRGSSFAIDPNFYGFMNNASVHGGEFHPSCRREPSIRA